MYVCMYVCSLHGNWGLITVTKMSQIIWSAKKNQGVIPSYITVKQGIYSEERDFPKFHALGIMWSY
jgi:pectin methylesterase-like acyl-CoA thioesterase